MLRVFLLSAPALASFSCVGSSKSNLYAITEYTLSYQHGFVKRGLVGEILRHCGYLTWHKLGEVQMVIMLLVLAACYAVFGRLLYRGPLPQAFLVLFLLLSPACLLHFAATVAHPDSLLFVLLLLAYAALVRLPAAVGPLVALAPCALALLLHESFPLLLYPVLAAIQWDRLRQGKASKTAVALHLSMFTAVFLLVLAFGKLHIPAAQLQAEAQLRTEVPLVEAIFDVVTRGFAGQWHELIAFYSWRLLAEAVLSTVVLLPYLIAAWKLLTVLNGVRRRPFPTAALVAMLVAPLLLSFLGMDLYRWCAGSLVCGLLFLVYLTESGEPEMDAAMNSLSQPFVSGAIVYGLAAGAMGAGALSLLGRVLFLISTGRG
ncbi:MAG: hypothetical protein PW735_00775 [Acidobacteriaceae bacterium]|nr:hypothetical protein [Acidobacteriaceae bacterium]